MEEKHLQKVNLGVATSENMQRTRRNSLAKTNLLTHDVDVKHFRAASRMELDDIIKDIYGPVVACYMRFLEHCSRTWSHSFVYTPIAVWDIMMRLKGDDLEG